MINISKTGALGLLLLLVFMVSTSAQGNRITVSGTVTDSAKAVIANAQLVLKVQECKCSDCPATPCNRCCPDQLKAFTNEAGEFKFTIPHGTYILDVSANNRKARIELDLNTGDTKTITVVVHEGDVGVA